MVECNSSVIGLIRHNKCLDIYLVLLITNSNHSSSEKPLMRGRAVQLTQSGICSSSMAEVYEAEPLHSNDNQFKQVDFNTLFGQSSQSTVNFISYIVSSIC